jgi:DNA-binding response OmpR family regulator
VLLASQPSVHVSLGGISSDFKWQLHHVTTCGEAIAFAHLNEPQVVVCERELPDGNWKDLLDAFDRLPERPNLIVTSRLTDEALWAEVLNLGGYDVLAQPFDPEEVFRVISLASRH